MTKNKAIFISHGAPNLSIHKTDHYKYLKGLGKELVKEYKNGLYKGILVFSAHWETRTDLGISSAEIPGVVYDFGGFERELYSMEYNVKTSKELINDVLDAIKEYNNKESVDEKDQDDGNDDTDQNKDKDDIDQNKGKDDKDKNKDNDDKDQNKDKDDKDQNKDKNDKDDDKLNVKLYKNKKFDHGVWSPFHFMFPEKHNIPVVQISLLRDGDAAKHIEIGRALRKLREKYLIIGSGAITHNLRLMIQSRYNPGLIGQGNKISTEWEKWISNIITKKSGKERKELLSKWLDHKGSRFAHPSNEHLFPLFVVSGIGYDTPGKKIFNEEDAGVASNSVFQF